MQILELTQDVQMNSRKQRAKVKIVLQPKKNDAGDDENETRTHKHF